MQSIPHVPHEGRSLRVTVDSSASGTSTNSSAQVAWLRSDLSDKLIVISAENFFDESFFSETLPNPKLNVRHPTKPLTAVSRRMRARARRGC
jgi:hypothetical protein